MPINPGRTLGEQIHYGLQRLLNDIKQGRATPPKVPHSNDSKSSDYIIQVKKVSEAQQ